MIVWDLAEYSLVAHEVTQSHPLLLAATSEALGFTTLGHLFLDLVSKLTNIIITTKKLKPGEVGGDASPSCLLGDA